MPLLLTILFSYFFVTITFVTSLLTALRFYCTAHAQENRVGDDDQDENDDMSVRKQLVGNFTKFYTTTTTILTLHPTLYANSIVQYGMSFSTKHTRKITLCGHRVCMRCEHQEHFLRQKHIIFCRCRCVWIWCDVLAGFSRSFRLIIFHGSTATAEFCDWLDDRFVYQGKSSSTYHH